MDNRGVRYVSASEVSEYEFCNVAWYYQKENYPRSRISSTRMASGRVSHQKTEKSYIRLTFLVRILIIFLAVAIAGILFIYF